MAAISDIISVSIQAGTVSPARQGFGVPLLVMADFPHSGAPRAYSSFSEVVADSVTSGTPTYKAAQIFFSQSPRPPQLKIAQSTPSAVNITTINAADYPDSAGDTITGSVVGPDGTTTAISVAFNTDRTTTLADLATAIDAISGIAGTSGATTATGTGDNDGEMWFFSFDNEELHVRDTSTDWDIDNTLDTLLDLDPSFYAVCCDNNSPKNMDKVARWAAANGKLAAFGPQYTDASDFDDTEFTSASDHTALMANENAFSLFTQGRRDTFPEVGLLGERLPSDPGSSNWAYKTINGLGADTWSSTQLGYIDDFDGTAVRKANHYTTVANKAIVRYGRTHGGEWLDVVRGQAWVVSELETALLSALINNPKIPYTETGMDILRSVIEGVLRRAASRGIYTAESISVTTIPVADQSTADRAARIVSNIEWSATLQGAVNKATVVGTVTV